MSYLKKMEYEIVLKDSFWVIRNCPKCGRKTYFKNTRKFRVNANGNKLDAWLIYQCEECKHTLNISIYERRKVSSIPKEEYQRFLKNDEQFAEMHGKNVQLFRKNKATLWSKCPIYMKELKFLLTDLQFHYIIIKKIQEEIYVEHCSMGENCKLNIAKAV